MKSKHRNWRMPEDRIRRMIEERSEIEAVLAQNSYMPYSLSEAELEEARAKYLRRLQEPFIYRGRPEPSMSPSRSPMMSEE